MTVPFGHITRLRGTGTEMEVQITDDAIDRGTSEYIFVRIDGLLVPFFWEEYRFKNDHCIILQLEDLPSREAAQRLVGCEVLYPLSELPEDEELTRLSSLRGYSIIDEKGEKLGEVEAVDERSQNVVLYLRRPTGEELLLPYHEDLVLDFSPKSRTLTLQVPEGLLDL